MKVIRASRAGFCMGVSLALKKLERALVEHEDKCRNRQGSYNRICTLGPIIHNPQVLAEYEARGVQCLEDAGHAQPGDCVLIRAHGVPMDVEAVLRKRCALVQDATCPKVKKAQLAIGEATAKGATLLLFGEADHPEVRGLVSYARGVAHVFGSGSELEKIDLDPESAHVLAAQTTQDREVFEHIARELATRLARLTILSTICDATRQRQEEALRIASQAQKMVVVGGRQSGNTRRLASLAANAGIPAYHVESASELRPDMFDATETIGLTAGASTPGSLIDEVEKWLHAL